MDDYSNIQTCGILKGCADGYVCHVNTEYDISVCCEVNLVQFFKFI